MIPVSSFTIPLCNSYKPENSKDSKNFAYLGTVEVLLGTKDQRRIMVINDKSVILHAVL